MSNHMVTWCCKACKWEMTAVTIIEPGWPNTHHHLRDGYCECCWENAPERSTVLLIDSNTVAGFQNIHDRLALKLLDLERSETMKPKAFFLQAGLPEHIARQAADAFSAFKNGLKAKKKGAKSLAESRLEDAIKLCMVPECELIDADDKERLIKAMGPTVTPEDLSNVHCWVGRPHIPGGLVDHGSAAPQGKQGLFYALSERTTILMNYAPSIQDDRN